MVRMFCAPTECWVQPRANNEVMVLSGAAVVAISAQSFRYMSCGVPQMRETISGV